MSKDPNAKNQDICFKCKKSYKDLFPLSCHHNYCQRCLCKTILKKHLMEIPDKDSIAFMCKCKRPTDLTLLKISEFLKKKNEQAIIKCQKHSETATKQCKECNIFLCEKCLSSHNDLFTDHNLSNLSDSPKKNLLSSVPNEDKCKEHNKDFSTYCKSCKISLCTFCLNDDEINKKHSGHNLILYKDYIDKSSDQQKKLQFQTFESFTNYINKVEDNFNKNFNDSQAKTIKTFEDFIKLLQSCLEEYKKKMEIKNNKRNTVMYIIKKVYESYYDDFKSFNSGNTSLSLIKFLSKPYSEFSELSFKSDLDTICEKINKLNNILKNEDIGSSIKISYAYFSKKELTLTTTLKKAFTDQINDIIELKDEKFIACSEDNTIKIYEKNGNPLYVLKGHTSGVRSLCLLKNDRFASGSADKTVRIWTLKHQKSIKVLKDQSNPIIALTLLVGDKLASCSFREVLIYDEHFSVKYKLTEHQNWVRGFIPTEKERYASCSDDGLIKIYDKHFRTLYNLKEHNESVMSICCLRDGRIVSGDKAGKIILWFKNFSNNKEIKEHNDAVMHIIQLKDGRVVTCSADKTIKIWDLDFRCLHTYKDHKGCVNRLVALRDGGFGSAGADCTLNFWR